MKTRTIYNILMSTVCITFLGVLSYIYLLTTEKSPVQYINSPMPVYENKVWKAGDVMRLVVNRCASRKTHLTIIRTFVSDEPSSIIQKIHVPSNEVEVTDTKCEKVLGLPIVVPEEITTGRWRIEHFIIAEGRWRTFKEYPLSESFMVENANPKPRVPSGVLPFPVVTYITTPVVIEKANHKNK